MNHDDVYYVLEKVLDELEEDDAIYEVFVVVRYFAIDGNPQQKSNVSIVV